MALLQTRCCRFEPSLNYYCKCIASTASGEPNNFFSNSGDPTNLLPTVTRQHNRSLVIAVLLEKWSCSCVLGAIATKPSSAIAWPSPKDWSAAYQPTTITRNDTSKDFTTRGGGSGSAPFLLFAPVRTVLLFDPCYAIAATPVRQGNRSRRGESNIQDFIIIAFFFFIRDRERKMEEIAT